MVRAWSTRLSGRGAASWRSLELTVAARTGRPMRSMFSARAFAGNLTRRIASAQARVFLCVEESPRERNGLSRVTFDLSDSRHPRIAALSGASSANSHINGSRTHGVADAPQTFDHCAVHAGLVARDNDDRRFAVWEQQASGIRFFSSVQAGRRAVMFCATCVPRRCRSSPACETRIALPSEPSLASAEVAFVDVEQPHTLAPLIERAAHVIYLVGGDRRGLAPGAWQLEVDSLSGCLELARRAGLPGRWISVGYSGSGQRTALTWAETRWRELKLAVDDVIVASGVNYFVLRTGLIGAPVSSDPRVSIAQDSAAADAELPCNALAFLLTGAALAGATNRSRVTVRVDPRGSNCRAQSGRSADCDRTALFFARQD